MTKRRATIDSRLADAVTSAARAGVAALTVDRVLAAAEVSRTSFYQYFPSIEECFFNAYRLHADRLISDVRTAIAGAPEPRIAALDVLVETAISRPDAAALLTIEGLASGPRGLRERQSLVSAICKLIDMSPRRRTIELPAVALVGGTMRYLAMVLAAGEVDVGSRAGVREWARLFASDGRRPLWQLRPSKNGSGDGSAPSSSRLPGFARAGGPRERVLRATAASVYDEGYRACNVADVAASAGVSRRYFYNHFEDKRAAVVSAYEYCFERVLAVCAPAFFGSGTSEDRVWEAGVAFARFFGRERALGHFGFGQPYALGPSFAGRIEEFHLAFTWFLDGRHYDPRSGAASVEARSVLTAAAVAEMAFQSMWHGASLSMLTELPLAMYVVLTPFVGRDRASEFAESKLRGHALEVRAAHSTRRR